MAMVMSTAYVLTRIVCEACLVVMSLMRQLVLLRKPTVSPVERRDLMIYRLFLEYSYLLSMYGGFVGSMALDKMSATPYLDVVSCVVPYVTKYICESIFCKVLRRLGTVNAER